MGCWLQVNSSPWPLSFLTVETDGSAGTDPEAAYIVHSIADTGTRSLQARKIISPLTRFVTPSPIVGCQLLGNGVFHMASPVPFHAMDTT